MARSEEVQGRRRAGFSLTQETITILTVGVALAGLIVVNLGDMRSEVRAYRAEALAYRAEALAYRAEARADREAIRAEARTDRTRFEAAMNLMRAEARADREAFAKQITRLVEQQGTLSGLVDGLRHAIASPEK